MSVAQPSWCSRNGMAGFLGVIRVHLSSIHDISSPRQVWELQIKKEKINVFAIKECFGASWQKGSSVFELNNHTVILVLRLLVTFKTAMVMNGIKNSNKSNLETRQKYIKVKKLETRLMRCYYYIIITVKKWCFRRWAAPPI